VLFERAVPYMLRHSYSCADTSWESTPAMRWRAAWATPWKMHLAAPYPWSSGGGTAAGVDRALADPGIAFSSFEGRCLDAVLQGPRAHPEAWWRTALLMWTPELN